MELKLQDYNVGDLIVIHDKYLGIVMKVDTWSLESIAINYPHKENQIFVTTEKYLQSIKKATHNA